jgi:integrase/recombinase XerD
MPKKARIRQPRALTLQEITALLDAIPRTGELGKRDYALFRLLLGNGARVSEVCNATVGDLGEEICHHILWLRVTKNCEPRR